MEANGVGFSPDVLLYNKIMDGITRNPGIQSPYITLSLILKRIRANSSFHQFPHRVSINAVDVRQTVLLLRAHPNVMLFDVDPNRLRQRFNDVYEALLAQSWMAAVMDLLCVVMPRHNLHGVRSLHSSHSENASHENLKFILEPSQIARNLSPTKSDGLPVGKFTTTSILTHKSYSPSLDNQS